MFLSGQLCVYQLWYIWKYVQNLCNLVVSSTGYYVSVLGPYLSDNKNNDAKTIMHALSNTVESMKSWLNEDNVIIVDRGFRTIRTTSPIFGIWEFGTTFAKYFQHFILPLADSTIHRILVVNLEEFSI
jgi:hypothetical protein